VDLVRSHPVLKTVTDDFTNSSTAGYVNLGNSSEINNNQQIANPFATNEQIKQKIQEQLDNSILDINTSTMNESSITCNFGTNLDAFSCSINP
jgi:hypothetical protein